DLPIKVDETFGHTPPAPLRAKFAAYHRCLAGARAAKEFDGPPSILVVTAGAAIEDRVVDAILAEEVGLTATALLTRVDLLITAEYGPLDYVWRSPGGDDGRRAWPDALAIMSRITSV